MFKGFIILNVVISLFVLFSNAVKQQLDIPFVQFVQPSQYVTIMSNNTLQVKYIPTSLGSPRIVFGKDIPIDFSNEAMLEYEIFFDKDFEWVNGGKLPGLISGSPKTVAVGCVKQPINGWSLRTMWRNKARAELYSYDQSRITNGNKCGNTCDSHDNVFTKNEWINVKMYIKLNTAANKSDGVAKLYIQNKLILQVNNIMFRGVSTGATIGSVSFQTFYGGHTSFWSPSKPTFAKFRGGKLYNYDVLNSNCR